MGVVQDHISNVLDTRAIEQYYDRNQQIRNCRYSYLQKFHDAPQAIYRPCSQKALHRTPQVPRTLYAERLELDVSRGW